MADGELVRILNVLSNAWAEGTAESYGSCLLSFHVVCDSKTVPEATRAPASPTVPAPLMRRSSKRSSFLSGSTISTYVSGVHAWHILHGVPSLLRAADRITSSSSKRQARMPYTTDILCKLHPHFDLSLPLEASVWSCLITLFWSPSRGGEFTVKVLTSFDLTIHVKPSDVGEVSDRNRLKQTNFALPQKESAPHGESVYWAEQTGPTDPKSGFHNHLSINSPSPNQALFSYLHGTSRWLLTKTAFKRRLTAVFKAADIDFIHIHGIGIGSALEYLLRRIPMSIMKAKGRWASDAFTIYLRHHSQMLAQYIQGEPQLHANVLRVRMPRVR
ncbi:hypothetical protein B0H13DRAFT_1673040 [Mycena leptocephala]|nr:hypothetical protein B0H13DRAFT_1673040 [Mycena leptocephala]